MKLSHNAEEIDVAQVLPVIPLRDVVIFPHMIYPLLVGRSFTINALQAAMADNRQVMLVAQRAANIDNPRQSEMYQVGLIARVLQVMKMPNGTLKVLVEGLVRAEIQSMVEEDGYLKAGLQIIPPDTAENDREIEALSRSVNEQFSEYVRLNRRLPDEVLVSVASIEHYHQQADTIAAHLLQKIEIKQRLLEAFKVRKQFEILSEVLKEEVEILRIEQRIDGTVRESMSRSQREFYLQQQLKAIKDELGQFDEPGAEVDDVYSRLDSNEYPDEVRAKAEEEAKKLSKMHPYSAEAAVVRSYLDWLLDLPWNDFTEDRTEFSQVKQILDSDHYGLEKAKKRIVEHLAIIKLAGQVKGPILCLVGPPGVGKTSVGRSIARAMGRRFVRMSLGGVHDEAEIRGHRRTYIGALPGRILQAVKKAGSANPVFLLDEVDKLGKDFRGDPASALLEVLDPEQNNTFTDNYLEVEFDLSNILFVTTANSMATIPPALRDRMEIIRLPGYLDFEKLAIARDYLLPKLKSEMGMKALNISFDEDAYYDIIRNYTREAGVRELERQLGAVLRKSAVKLAEGSKVRHFRYSRRKVAALLGAPKYADTNLKTQPTVGYAIGLAWTEMGGDVMPVEVALMRGKGKLTLTGSLGDVMQESAAAALSFVREYAARFGLNDNFFENLELHVHIPEGSVPKEGPSAGVTLLTAFISVLTGIPVRSDIAMTGEVTLTGDVLAVGGLNEKLLAAKRLGIKEIIVPAKNRKDIAELQSDLVKGLKIHYVRSVKQMLGLSLVRNPFVKPHARAIRQRHLGLN